MQTFEKEMVKSCKWFISVMLVHRSLILHNVITNNPYHSPCYRFCGFVNIPGMIIVDHFFFKILKIIHFILLSSMLSLACFCLTSFLKHWNTKSKTSITGCIEPYVYHLNVKQEMTESFSFGFNKCSFMSKSNWSF